MGASGRDPVPAPDGAERRSRLRQYQVQLLERVQAAASGPVAGGRELGVQLGGRRFLLDLTQIGEIAPPQALMALSMGAWWLPPFLKERAEAEDKEAGIAPGAAAHGIVVDFGFGTATNVTREEEYFEPFGPGDGRLGHADTLVDVSPIKQTRVGRGVFLTTDMDYITEKGGVLVARARNVLLMYDGSTGRKE